MSNLADLGNRNYFSIGQFHFGVTRRGRKGSSREQAEIEKKQPLQWKTKRDKPPSGKYGEKVSEKDPKTAGS